MKKTVRLIDARVRGYITDEEYKEHIKKNSSSDWKTMMISVDINEEEVDNI
ncbi:MAG: hypothetical protein GYA36_23305 [Veillonellaceae bacterium]|nr:hypothetical protein [Veillonellaceae bacterium]